MYQEDNNGYMPAERHNGENTFKMCWLYKMAPYYGVSLEGLNAAAIQKTAIAKVMCPSHTKAASENYYGIIVTYGVNIACDPYKWDDGHGVSGYWGGGEKSRLGSSIPDSSGTVMVIESYSTYAYPASVAANATDAKDVKNRHGEKCNMVMCDGHVESEDIIKYNTNNKKGIWTVVSGD